VAQPPDSARLAERGFHVLFDVSDLGIPAATSVIAVRRGDVETRRPTLQALVDAVGEANQVLRTDPERSQQVLARRMNIEDSDALTEAWAFYAEKVVPRDLHIEPTELAAAKDVLAAQNPRLTTYDVTQLVDNSFANAAVAGGRSPVASR
jgi:ABC-type nitrate/sulfonate/bicarbonate transport system substrate-binding protein